MLRYAEALQATQSAEVATQIEALKQRFSAAMLRGDTVHQREQSRFELRLMQNPAKALQIAKLNWVVQKEPADVLVYLEAATAAKDQAAIQTITQWLATVRLEDVALTHILTQEKRAS